MNEEAASRLHAFLEKARAKLKPTEPVASPFPGEDPVVVELIRSFLVWEAGAGFAERVLRRIRDHVVDFNELRVFLPDEISGMMGAEDPRSQERAERLRASLNEVYSREHDMRLAHLTDEGKRDIRAYLDTLDGMHPFVAARVTLLCFGGHAFPIDGRLRDALSRARVVPADHAPGEVGSWIERQVRAGEAASNYAALEALVEAQTPRPAARTTKTTKRPAEPRAPRPKKPAEAKPAKSAKRAGTEK